MQVTNPPSITSQELLALAQAAHGSGDPETRWDLFWVQDEHGDFRQGGVYVWFLNAPMAKSAFLLSTIPAMT